MVSCPRICRRRLAMLAALPLLQSGRIATNARGQELPARSIGGVVGEIDRKAAPMPPQLTRSMQPELLALVPPAEPGPMPFPGEFRAWLDRADARYSFGDTAQIGVESSVAAFIQILGVSATGRPIWLFPPDRLSSSHSTPTDPVALRPNEPLLVPQPELHRFVLRIREPAGSALVFVIASLQPLSVAMRQRLQARIAEAAGSVDSHRVLREELTAIARAAPALCLTHVGLPYLSEPAAGLPSSNEGQLSALVDRPVRALEWLRPTSDWEQTLGLSLNGQSFAAGERLALRVRAERTCQLLAAALGNGGRIDLLYPNARQRGVLSAGRELTLPPPGGDLRLRVRGARFGWAEEERILVIARAPGAPSLIGDPFPGSGATLTFTPDSAEGMALGSSLRSAELDRVVAEIRYHVGPPRSS